MNIASEQLREAFRDIYSAELTLKFRNYDG